jgi:hypothetical protein
MRAAPSLAARSRAVRESVSGTVTKARSKSALLLTAAEPPQQNAVPVRPRCARLTSRRLELTRARGYARLSQLNRSTARSGGGG